MPPLPPLEGTHFSRIKIVSRLGSDPSFDHAQMMSCLHCDLSKILEQARPPDPELVDLIEHAFIEGQIDGLGADLAYTYLWLDTGKEYCMYIQ